MARSTEVDLTPEEAVERAQHALASGPLAQLGIKIAPAEDAAVRIALGLAEAASVDALLSGGDTNGWEQHEGRSFLIRSAEFVPSTKPGGLGFYAVVQVVDAETGEQLTLTTGAQNVVIQVAKMVTKGWTDVPVALKTGVSASGNSVHRLVKGDAGATPF